MSKYYEPQENNCLEFDEFIEVLNSFGENIFTSENKAAAKDALQGLYKNKIFLANKLNDYLKDAATQAGNLYTFQVFMLAQEKYFNIRAPIWLPPIGYESEEAFVYELPHDHNFELMTMGYLGPGYKTDIYKYQIDKVKGVCNEPVDIDFVGKYQLKEGSVIYLEKNRDIHIQYSPEEMSVSVNIMKTSNISRTQFLFDVHAKKIIKPIDESIVIPLFNLASEIGDENTVDLICELASKSPKNKYIEVGEACAEKIINRKSI